MFTQSIRLICLTVSFSEALESHWLSKLPTNHNGALPGCTVEFDWLKVWQAGAPGLQKNLQSIED